MAQVEWQKCKGDGGVYHVAEHGEYTLYAWKFPQHPISMWFLYKGIQRDKWTAFGADLYRLMDAKAAAEAALEKHLATE